MRDEPLDHSTPRLLRGLLGGDPETLLTQFKSPGRSLCIYLLCILFGAGSYGATIGLWRAPLQGAFTAIKFPLLIILTTAFNSLLNGMLAQGLGLTMGFRACLLAITASFALTSLILASLAPVALFLLLNTPPLGGGATLLAHNATQLAHVGMIALAGVLGTTALYRLLLHASRRPATARRVLTAWLIGNLFLGCQLSWVMRPFIGSPGLAVEFLRRDAFLGNFYESVWRSLTHVLSTENKEK